MTPLQRRFVEEYLVDLNGARAARRAGYASKWANTSAARLLARPEIRAAVDEALAARRERTAVDGDRVIAELAKIAFASAGEFLRWGPETVALRDQNLLTPEQQAAVAEVVQSETKTGKTVRLKLYDKQAALDRLVRYLGLFQAPPEAEEDREYVGMSDTERAQRVLALFERVRKAREAEAAKAAAAAYERDREEHGGAAPWSPPGSCSR